MSKKTKQHAGPDMTLVAVAMLGVALGIHIVRKVGERPFCPPGALYYGSGLSKMGVAFNGTDSHPTGSRE